jgi:hypothetical protein
MSPAAAWSPNKPDSVHPMQVIPDNESLLGLLLQLSLGDLIL